MLKTLKNRKGFTLIELIVVIVIISILGTIGFNSVSNYINDAKLSKVEQAYSSLRNDTQAKFGQSFNDGDIVFDLEKPSGTGSTNSLSGATTSPSFSSTSSSINVNGKKVVVADASSNTILSLDNLGISAAVNAILGISMNDTNLEGTLYYPVNDETLCKSDSYKSKKVNGTKYVTDATGKKCYIYNEFPMVLMK